MPVVAAPHGLALGGGCEICLPPTRCAPTPRPTWASSRSAWALLPAGGGVQGDGPAGRAAAEAGDVDPIPFVLKAFSTVAMAKVSSAAEEARVGFLRPDDQDA